MEQRSNLLRVIAPTALLWCLAGLASYGAAHLAFSRDASPSHSPALDELALLDELEAAPRRLGRERDRATSCPPAFTFPSGGSSSRGAANNFAATCGAAVDALEDVLSIKGSGWTEPFAGPPEHSAVWPTEVEKAKQLNAPLGADAADRIAKAIRLNPKDVFTAEQYTLITTGGGINGNVNYSKLIVDSVDILTNTLVNPGYDGSVLASYGLWVNERGLLESPANTDAQTRQINEILIPGGWLGQWCRANGATKSLANLYKSVYLPEALFGAASQQISGVAQLVANRKQLGSKVIVGMPMVPSIWIVNFALIYVLSPALAAQMPAYWAAIPPAVASAIEESPTGQVQWAEYKGFFVPAPAPPHPHILYVLVDDWGWKNVGYHSPNDPETQTPNMNALVKEGIELDRHYTHLMCSPTRSSLQTGRLPIHVNAQNEETGVHNPADENSGYAGIPLGMTGIAQKLAAGGYATSMAGKWDIGMATPKHTPAGRGYNTSLAYFSHAVYYWNSSIEDEGGSGENEECDGKAVIDLWDNDVPYAGRNSKTDCFQTLQYSSHAGCTYEDDYFLNRTLEVIAKHDPSVPLFHFWSPHIAHTPLAAPDSALAHFSFMSNEQQSRYYYSAMVWYMDQLLGKVVNAIKAKGMWDSTLMVLSADNGGPLYFDSQSPGLFAGANNYPLKGGKFSNFEGGIRTNAFVSGGYLPEAVRGTKKTGLISVADWYATFAALADVSAVDETAAQWGLPAVDGINQWPYLSSARARAPRTELALGGLSSYESLGGNTTNTFVGGMLRSDGWKLLIRNQSQPIWTGPSFPNFTTYEPNCDVGFSCLRDESTERYANCVGCSGWIANQKAQQACGFPGGPDPLLQGCLYNVFTDPSEYNNLALTRTDIALSLYQRIQAYEAGVFNPDRGVQDGLKCSVVTTKWGGTLGPFLPTPPQFE